MPATSEEYVGTKVVGVPPPNAPGKTLTGVLVLCDAEGTPVGFLNSQELTAFRTALGPMPLLQLRREVANVVVFGAGKQAFWHIRLTLMLRPGEVESITIVNRSKPRADELIQNLKAFVGSDVEFLCFVKGAEQLGPKKRSYIAAIGSYHESMSELDPKLFRKIIRMQQVEHIIVDSKSACFKEAGEIIQAKLKEEDVYEIGVMLRNIPRLQEVKEEEMDQGAYLEREWYESGLMIYKSVGMGVMILAVGGAILELAKSKNVGDNSLL
ncbi:NAD(P)-binding protein [Bimuria novae-zelandiae CBS 107.79]|uniref:NAD(P)-binding protein n=1 Tax=Bimuria novae-zelandiae CBS 107.79 TaxID=1447943 RepID=A0A6A5V0S4_9PLEO|nr:NAD(P)-binding protein [Bimuria novae-zelandiae CBS 107.79]